MPDRLTKIVTRRGDKGTTGLGDGTRLSKTDARIALIGEIDELNSWIGVVLAHAPGEAAAATLARAQHDLFDLGGGLAMPGAPLLSPRHVARLDEAAAALNKDLLPLKEFILPGGAPLVAWLHVARTVCRRAERAAVRLLAGEEAGAAALAYLNRLSDYLFIAARFEAKRLGAGEVLWRKGGGSADD
ncbi:cob(I)yrinic acid a,c-diamide adenosyltransferase [Amphiplicatus metriothermophilus]|uniref:Corrinoid adenosyltransferase n=1 Tax=Amphiplicatus metriothermophilus TaxID=1519374 RepID=A0A239PLM5_9PROT|nr:cob(I)yrinic acid a,c-diamide adenosyltransferase [Amphiplicatus metriothermophilus]MBB5517426.1 cob(I)alamin adenosyltransferase [Amphiplicatus metriothermophilus]SNT68239.1 ATP:cob(I)alamin adenosyltransferase [Amphiplicatus metriothermophilus]